MNTLSIEAILVLLSAYVFCKPIETNVSYSITVKREDYPWMVSVQLDLYGHLCIGTLITLEHVLSTATCVKIGIRIFKTYGLIVAGDTLTGSRRDNYSQVRNIGQIISHPKYNCLSNDNNVAVIEVVKPFIERMYVRPTISSNKKPEPYSKCDIAGWVYVRPYEEKFTEATLKTRVETSEVKRARFTVLYDEACNQIQNNGEKICLHYHIQEGAICPRLRGGALICGNYLYGIYTGESDCQQLDDLYSVVSVPFYFGFIQKAVNRSYPKYNIRETISDKETIAGKVFLSLTIISIGIGIAAACLMMLWPDNN